MIEIEIDNTGPGVARGIVIRDALPDGFTYVSTKSMTGEAIRTRTSDPAIYAAGDVVRFPGPHGLVRLEDWRHAQDQGAVAGRNAAGATEPYRSVPSFWSEQYDLYLQGVGWPSVAAQRVRRPLPGNSMLVFETDGTHVTAALGINAQRDIAAVRRLIERRIPVDLAALADPARPLAELLKVKA